MPIEDIQTFKVICRGGLNSNRNILDLSDNYPGYGVTLQNFEPSLFGGYRRINGFTPLEEDFPEITNSGDASGKILGVAIYDDGIYAFRADLTSTNYNMFKWIPGSDWALVAGLPTRPMSANSQTVNKIRYVTFNYNGTEKVAFADGVNPLLLWDGTTFTECLATATGADYANAGGDQLPASPHYNNPKYVTLFKNHLFVSGFSSAPHLVIHSAPEAEYDWTVASGAGQVIAAFKVNQIKPFRDANYIFGVNRIRKITVQNTSFVIDDVTQNVGNIADDSVVEIAGDLFYLSQDGIRTIAGTERIGDIELGNIAKNIQEDLTDLFLSQGNKTLIDSVVIRKKSQYRLFFNDSSIDSNNTSGIIGGIKGNIDGSVGWEWGRLKGIRTSCATSDYINSVEYVIHGDFNGKVYRQEIGNSFDNQNIHATYATPFLDFGDTTLRKTYRYIYVFLRPEGSVSLDTSLRFNWDNYGTINPNPYLLESVGSPPIWGTAVWGDFEYGNSGMIPVNSSPIEGSAFAVQTVFDTDDMSAPYSIQGVVFEYTINGRQ